MVPSIFFPNQPLTADGAAKVSAESVLVGLLVITRFSCGPTKLTPTLVTRIRYALVRSLRCIMQPNCCWLQLYHYFILLAVKPVKYFFPGHELDADLQISGGKNSMEDGPARSEQRSLMKTLDTVRQS